MLQFRTSLNNENIFLEPMSDISTIALHHQRFNPLALESQTSINKLEAPSVYQRSSKMQENIEKNFLLR